MGSRHGNSCRWRKMHRGRQGDDLRCCKQCYSQARVIIWQSSKISGLRGNITWISARNWQSRHHQHSETTCNISKIEYNQLRFVIQPFLNSKARSENVGGFKKDLQDRVLIRGRVRPCGNRPHIKRLKRQKQRQRPRQEAQARAKAKAKAKEKHRRNV